jgi:hypothetical protein
MLAGMASSISVSSDEAPTSLSIAATSSPRGPICLGAKVSRGGNGTCFIFESIARRRRIHQRGELTGAAELHFDHPRLVRLAVDVIGAILERAVDLDNFAAHGAKSSDTAFTDSIVPNTLPA